MHDPVRPLMTSHKNFSIVHLFIARFSRKVYASNPSWGPHFISLSLNSHLEKKGRKKPAIAKRCKLPLSARTDGGHGEKGNFVPFGFLPLASQLGSALRQVLGCDGREYVFLTQNFNNRLVSASFLNHNLNKTFLSAQCSSTHRFNNVLVSSWYFFTHSIITMI